MSTDRTDHRSIYMYSSYLCVLFLIPLSVKKESDALLVTKQGEFLEDKYIYIGSVKSSLRQKQTQATDVTSRSICGIVNLYFTLDKFEPVAIQIVTKTQYVWE